jgi:hypothetical protein
MPWSWTEINNGSTSSWKTPSKANVISAEEVFNTSTLDWVNVDDKWDTELIWTQI